MRDPWVALARAAKSKRGLRLTAEEVAHMFRIDEALQAAAESCQTECVCDIMRFNAVCDFCDKDHD